VTDRIAPGCVSIKEGAWFTPDARGEDTKGCANVLTGDRASPAAAAAFNSTFVDIAAVDEGRHGSAGAARASGGLGAISGPPSTDGSPGRA